MAGEIELLTERTLTYVVGQDAAGLAGRSPTGTVARDLKIKAQRLLDASRRVTPLVAMSSPPTVATGTAGGATAVTSPVELAANDSRLTYLASDPQPTGVLQLAANIKADVSSGAAAKGGYYGGHYMKLTFMTDSPSFDFILQHHPTSWFRLLVDGQPTTLTPTATSGDYSQRRTKVTFSGTAPRLIEIEFGGANPTFGPVNVQTGYSVWKPEVDALRTLLIGDSYFDNGAGYGSDYINSLGPLFMRSLGVSDGFLDAIGGDGYLNLGSFHTTGETPRVRLPYEVTPYAPDWIGVNYGINDGAQVLATLQAEVPLYYAAMLLALPKTIITVWGPWRASGALTTQAVFDAVKNGVNAQTADIAIKRLAFIDTFAENWQNSGNYSLYQGADNIHPNQAGQTYLAARMKASYQRHLESIIAAA